MKTFLVFLVSRLNFRKKSVNGIFKSVKDMEHYINVIFLLLLPA